MSHHSDRLGTHPRSMEFRGESRLTIEKPFVVSTHSASCDKALLQLVTHFLEEPKTQINVKPEVPEISGSFRNFEIVTIFGREAL